MYAGEQEYREQPVYGEYVWQQYVFMPCVAEDNNGVHGIYRIAGSKTAVDNRMAMMAAVYTS